jgi:hypothetical protein
MNMKSKTGSMNRLLKKLVPAALAFALLISICNTLTASAAETPIGGGVLQILGIDISADPAQQSVPVNTGTRVGTEVSFPQTEPPLSEEQILSLAEDFLIMAELTGPGITTPKIITAKPLPRSPRSSRTRTDAAAGPVHFYNMIERLLKPPERLGLENTKV